MALYERLLKRKSAGEMLNLEELTPNDLEKLFIDESKSDEMIASLFEVKSSKITYLRRKHGITIRNAIVKDFLDDRSDARKELNAEMKKVTLSNENVTKISKAVVHFAFRNGPIEDMHAETDG